MATSTEEILLRVGLDANGIKSGMMEAKRGLTEGFKEIGQKIIAAFAIERVFEFGKRMVENADAIDRTANRLGMTTEQVQRLQYAANMADQSIESLANAFDKLARAKEGGTGGDQSIVKAFADFGVSLSDIRDMKPDELFRKIAESIEQTGVNSKVTADLFTLFGKSAGELKPVLKEFSENYRQAFVIPDNDIKNLAQVDNSVKKIWSFTKAVASSGLAILTSPIDSLVTAANDPRYSSNFNRLTYQAAQLDKEKEEKRKAELDAQEAIAKSVQLAQQEDAQYLKQEKERLQINKEISAAKREQHDIEKQRANIDQERPTIAMLAGRGFMGRLNKAYGAGGQFDLEAGDGPFARIAQQAALAQKQQLWDIIHGNAKFDSEGNLIGGQAFLDKKKQIKLENMLAGAGIITPEMQYRMMDEKLGSINDKLSDLSVKIKSVEEN